MTEDLIQGSFNARNLPLEIGCRGVRNAANLEYICNQQRFEWKRADKSSNLMT